MVERIKIHVMFSIFSFLFSFVVFIFYLFPITKQIATETKKTYRDVASSVDSSSPITNGQAMISNTLLFVDSYAHIVDKEMVISDLPKGGNTKNPFQKNQQQPQQQQQQQHQQQQKNTDPLLSVPPLISVNGVVKSATTVANGTSPTTKPANATTPPPLVKVPYLIYNSSNKSSAKTALVPISSLFFFCF